MKLDGATLLQAMRVSYYTSIFFYLSLNVLEFMWGIDHQIKLYFVTWSKSIIWQGKRSGVMIVFNIKCVIASG